MKIEICETYNDLSIKAKEIILEEIKKKKNLLLCTATGSSPTGTYQQLCNEYHQNANLFSQLRIVKLDEWGGIEMKNSTTCESYLQQNLIKPLHIDGLRYFGFESNPENPNAECDIIQSKLATEGPIDVCILGLGMNGHLAFNEPAKFLQPHCHVANLSAQSQTHPMASGLAIKPTYGLTLGMADIFASKLILMLVSGKGKTEIIEKMLSQQISTELPASFLWLHPKVVCLIEK